MPSPSWRWLWRKSLRAFSANQMALREGLMPYSPGGGTVEARLKFAVARTYHRISVNSLLKLELRFLEH